MIIYHCGEWPSQNQLPQTTLQGAVLSSPCMYMTISATEIEMWKGTLPSSLEETEKGGRTCDARVAAETHFSLTTFAPEDGCAFAQQEGVNILAGRAGRISPEY